MVCSYGQSSVEAVLKEIERNNPGLKAAAAGLDEERLANRSEALLENPEVEFNYLLGGENIGNRHDVRVSQSFDIPTLSGQRSRMVASLNDLSALKYEMERLAVLQEARGLCVDLIHCNALLGELSTHLAHSKTLVESYEKKMKAGNATILDLNKAKLHLTSIQGQVNKNEAERQSLLSSLKALNGGREISFDSTVYDISDGLPLDFDEWYSEASAKNPELALIRKEVELGQRQLSIDKTALLPDIAVGYMSEIRTVEKFRGVTLGVSVPLWSGSNKVKKSRAGLVAAEARQDAAEREFHSRMRNLYMQASAMKSNSEMMRSALTETDNRDFLLSALTRGEISMIDYLVETDLYYDALEQTLSAEQEYRHSLAALKVF